MEDAPASIRALAQRLRASACAQGGIARLRPVVEAVSLVQAGTDRTAAELALLRLGKEVEQLHLAWRQQDNRFPPQNIGGFLLGVVLAVVAAACVLWGVISLIEPERPPAAAQTGECFLIAALLLAAGGVLLMRATAKRNQRLTAQRTAAYQPYHARLQYLTDQIARNRAMVEGRESVKPG
jgi:uncharacterized membrane protein YidH (DUF202 family)